MLKGIDISNHQAGANFAALKKSEIAFVFAKATEGLTFDDASFKTFRKQAHDVGLPFGAYHFARPQAGRTGEQEATHFLEIVGDIRLGEMPCVLDIESTTLSADKTALFAVDFLDAVKKYTGVTPYLYSYVNFLQTRMTKFASLSAYPLWIASYSKNAPTMPINVWSRWNIWQYSSGGTVPGISGRVDLNMAPSLPPIKTTVEKDSVMATIAQNQVDFDALIWRVEGILNFRDTVAGGPTKGEKIALTAAIKALANSGGVVDVNAIADAVRQEFVTNPLK